MRNFGDIGRSFQGERLGARAVRGTAFTILSFGGNRALRLLSNLVLTRLLFPEAFGLMALVGVVLGGIEMFSDLGLRASIVQDKRGDDPAFLNTAWTIQIFRGFVLGAVVFLLAEPMAAFYEAPLLADLLRVSALVPIINGFVSVNLMQAGRHLRLGRQSLMTLGSQTVGILVMILLAWWLQSVWALVVGTLVAPILMVIMSHILMPGPRARIGFERDAVGRLIGFGKWVLLATISAYFLNQSDRIILGKFVDLETLALYHIGFLFAMLPRGVGWALNQRVVFPLFARRPPWESDANRIKINRSRRLLTGAAVLGLGFMSLIGDDLVRLLYDPRYHGAGSYIVLISLAAMPQMITFGYDNLALAAGDSRRYAIYRVCLAMLIALLTFLGASAYGVVGVILALPLSYLVSYPALLMMIRPYRGWDPLHDLGFALFAGVIATGAIWYNFDALAALFAPL